MLAFLAALVLAASGTSLKITVWPDGPNARSHTTTLRCAPAGGTLPRAGDACGRLGAMDDAFAPVPPDAVCTMIFGGPQRALVTGTYRGRRVWTRFDRRDGCHIRRWNAHAFLFRAP